MRIDAPTFAGGEIGDVLVQRSDTAKYQTGLRRARNVLTLVTGGAYARPGLRFVGEVKDSTKAARLIPFQFSISQSYVLEFGHETIRFIQDGGYVLEQLQTITAITKAAQAQVTMPCHGYAVGEDIYFSGVLGMTQINGLTGRVVDVVDTDNFKVNINTSTGFSTFTGDSGGVDACAVPPPPPPDPEDPPDPPPYEDEDPDPGPTGDLLPGDDGDGQVN